MVKPASIWKTRPGTQIELPGVRGDSARRQHRSGTWAARFGASRPLPAGSHNCGRGQSAASDGLIVAWARVWISWAIPSGCRRTNSDGPGAAGTCNRRVKRWNGRRTRCGGSSVPSRVRCPFLARAGWAKSPRPVRRGGGALLETDNCGRFNSSRLSSLLCWNGCRAITHRGKLVAP
jgi:hypothetical protein